MINCLYCYPHASTPYLLAKHFLTLPDGFVGLARFISAMVRLGADDKGEKPSAPIATSNMGVIDTGPDP